MRLVGLVQRQPGQYGYVPVQGSEYAAAGAAAAAAGHRVAGQHGSIRIRRFRRLVRDGQLDRHRGGRRHCRTDQLFPWRRHPATGGQSQPRAFTAAVQAYLPLRARPPRRTLYDIHNARKTLATANGQVIINYYLLGYAATTWKSTSAATATIADTASSGRSSRQYTIRINNINNNSDAKRRPQ